MMAFTSFLLGLMVLSLGSTETIPATKVFVLPVEPAMFNWTIKLGDEFSYRASLLNAPDLPKWIEYLYSEKHKMGYLYGVPPQNQKELEIEIIAMNGKTYETRRRVIHLNVENKPDAATREVHMKIDNLNVDDFFDSHRMTRLLKIFKYKLWKESFFDLYYTFLINAVSLGARRPLRPTEGEGVVVRLGSTAEFSNTLIELQEEVKPLWKLQSCPRDFKRTTVERIFRDEGFILDWCNFKLIRHRSNEIKASDRMQNLGGIGGGVELSNEPLWSRPTKAQVARRSYTNEFALTILLPTFIMISLVILLSAILGIQHESLRDESDDFFDSVFCICEDYCRLKKKSVRTDISTSEFFGSTSRPSNNFCGISDVNDTSRSRASAQHLAARSIVANGVSRPTPPPYNGNMWSTIVDF